jgi:hypothetical protein
MAKYPNLARLTVFDISRVKKFANFTETQEQIFDQLCKDRLDYAIIQTLHISNRKYYEDKPIVFEKVAQIVPELFK